MCVCVCVCVCDILGYLNKVYEILIPLNFPTAGNPWAVPHDWDSAHPQLNLNLDDEVPHVLHNGAVHVATEVRELSVLLVTN